MYAHPLTFSSWLVNSAADAAWHRLDSRQLHYIVEVSDPAAKVTPAVCVTSITHPKTKVPATPMVSIKSNYSSAVRRWRTRRGDHRARLRIYSLIVSSPAIAADEDRLARDEIAVQQL